MSFFRHTDKQVYLKSVRKHFLIYVSPDFISGNQSLESLFGEELWKITDNAVYTVQWQHMQIAISQKFGNITLILHKTLMEM